MSDHQNRLSRIQEMMRETWDRRVANEYRYWMSDGVEDDEAMWNAGERDLHSLLAGLSAEELREQRALEVGCGVGRLLRHAARIFYFVTGVDVSPQAIAKAADLLGDLDSVEAVCIPGTDLGSFAAEEFDLVYSFAVLGHMPSLVFSGYMLEMNRVLRIGGCARLQIYLGKEQDTVIEDTLAIRCYDEERLRKGFNKAGFRIEALDELVMPFDAIDRKNQIYPYVAKLVKTAVSKASAEQLHETLLSREEPSASGDWAGSRLEYRMAVTRVHQLIEVGRLEQARDTLKFAIENYKDAEPEARAILEELQKG